MILAFLLGTSNWTPYLFTALEFEQIFNLSKNDKFIYSFRNFEFYNKIKIPEYLLEKANKNNKETPMAIRIADDGMMIRFLLPDQALDEKNDILKSKYFEMPLKKFYDWLNPVAPQK